MGAGFRFRVPACAPQLVYQRPWYVLFWDGAYKIFHAAERKSNPWCGSSVVCNHMSDAM